MPTFIALPRRSRLQTMGIEALSTEEKRQLLWESSVGYYPELSDTPQSILGRSLADIGFEQIPSLPEIFVETWGTNQHSSKFMCLNFLGVYVFNSEYSQKIEDAQEKFNEFDYVVVPDVQLSLPKPICTDEVFWRERRPSWPDESGIYQAHNRDITGSGVLVGVLDTGCDADHIQLREKQIDFRYVPHHSEFAPMRDVRGFDVDGHGTHVCGIIAGKHVGVAPEVDLLVAAVLESETDRTTLSRIVRGLDWILAQISSGENCDKPAIINMSFGFITEKLNRENRTRLMFDVRRLISFLIEDYNALFVVAIGNEGPGQMQAPGYFSETLSVGAVDFNHIPASFSGGGVLPNDDVTQPDIAGYGVGIFSCLERNRNNRSSYICMSGTSMAAPYVAGIAALYASANPNLQGKILERHLLNTALPLQAEKDRVGAGLARFT